MTKKFLATATIILILATVFTGCGRDKELNPADKAVLSQNAAQVSRFWEEKDKTEPTETTVEETTTEATTEASTETTTEVEKEEVIVDLQANRSRLTEVEQKAYDKFLKKIYKYEEFVVDFSEEEISFESFYNITSAIEGDHPEVILFLYTDESISPERCNGKPRYIQVSYKYNWIIRNEFNPKYMDDYLAQIDQVGEEILEGMPQDASNAEKYEYLGREICKRTTYLDKVNEDLPDSEVDWSDCYLNGALLYGEASCQGYSYAYQYLCHRAGLWCVTVFSNTHCWNMVMLEDGSTYHIDLTWADSSDDFAENFLLTQEEAEIFRTPIEGSWVANGK